MRTILLLTVSLLTSCSDNWECKKQIENGTIVKNKLTQTKAIVLKSAEIKNLDGYCIIDIRTEKGTITTATFDELVIASDK